MQQGFLAGNTVSENCIQEMAEEIELKLLSFTFK
jgi:hypothetical protein